MDQGDDGDGRADGGAGPLDRGRGALINLLDRALARARRDATYYPDHFNRYDAHTYAAAGVAPGDRDEHGAIPDAHTETAEGHGSPAPDVPGDDRPRPYLLRADRPADPRTYIPDNEFPFGVRRPNLRRRSTPA
jgi:hypothetical protein